MVCLIIKIPAVAVQEHAKVKKILLTESVIHCVYPQERSG